MTVLQDWLRRAARDHPDKAAAEFCGVSPEDAVVTYGDLDRDSDRVAAYLGSLGIGRGDRVAILHANSVSGLLWFWGVLKAGASTVDVPGLAGRATICGILEEACPQALALDAQHWAALGDVTDASLPKIVLGPADIGEEVVRANRDFHALDTILAWDGALAANPASEPEDVALIVYTSGTTGRPSGVMLRHSNLVANLSASNEEMGLKDDERILVVVPLYYIHGRMQLLLHAMLGGTLVFSLGFQFPQKVLLELRERRCTAFSGVPYHFKQLLDRSKLPQTTLPDLRYVLITGGALAERELHRLSDALPGVGIHLAYGQTEAAPRITWIGPHDLFARRGSVGRALRDVQLAILDSEGRSCPPGHTGEVVAGGPNIMAGYVRGDHIELGKIDEKGRLRTGDLGRVDDDGYLFLVGRSSEMIKTAGERIFPQEVEGILLTAPHVREAAVIGLPDPLLGERMVAYVVVAEGAAIEGAELKAHCLKNLPFVRVPKRFDIVEALPKTGSGKINRSKLRQDASSGSAG